VQAVADVEFSKCDVCWVYRLRNDLLCVGWGVKLYSLTYAGLIALVTNRFLVHTPSFRSLVRIHPTSVISLLLTVILCPHGFSIREFIVMTLDVLFASESVELLLHYCKTLYFCCILISRFWNVEISLHFNLAFSQCSISIYQQNFRGYLIRDFILLAKFVKIWCTRKMCFTVSPSLCCRVIPSRYR